MAAPVALVDFSTIYVSKSELRLLREICGRPQKRRTEDRSEEAERLASLGLIEMFENKDSGRHGLFATETGQAFLEYTDNARRSKWIAFIKWLIPLILAIGALVLAIRANSLLGWNSGRTANVAAGQSYQQRSTAATNSPTSTANPQAGSSEMQSGTASSEASQPDGTSQTPGQQEASGSGEASEESPDARD